MSKITILGSGSCNLVPSRAAASTLVQRGGKNFVYDFGRGISTKLTEVGLKQDDVQTVILSHLHPDHVTDLYPFLQAASWSQIDTRSNDLVVYGHPGTQEFMVKFQALFEWDDHSRSFSLTAHDLKTGSNTIDGRQFEFVDLHHSYGMKFVEHGKRYAIMTDSQLHDDLVAALKDVDLGIFDSGHITDDEIIELAVRSQAKQLVCSHQYRELDGAKLNAAAKAQGYNGQLLVAHDLMEFAI